MEALPISKRMSRQANAQMLKNDTLWGKRTDSNTQQGRVLLKAIWKPSQAPIF